MEGGQSAAFAYVLDVVPTLLEFAGVAATPSDAALLRGRSMVALLKGKSQEVHAPSEAIGYEAAGGAALYRGDEKLVRSTPPYGDGKWRLYDITRDPTESHNFAQSEPGKMQSLLTDYQAYAKKNGVVEVPTGYNVLDQAQTNAAKKELGWLCKGLFMR